MTNIEEFKSITMTIAGRNFPLTVSIADESKMLEIEKEVNIKINEFLNEFTTRDKIDGIIMALLTYAYDLKNSNFNYLPSEIEKSLDSLNQNLNDIILQSES